MTIAGPLILVVLSASSCSKSPVQANPKPLYERDVSAGIHNLAPVRGTRGPLRLNMDGDEYECSMCHEGFTGEFSKATLEGQHANIVFDHGLNLLCLNCHNPKNSDAYVYHDGSEIPADESTRLCAKCHGPHFREWSLDVHGRVNGAWDDSRGIQTKLDCIQCHDPHRPKFQRMKPLAPPVLTRFEEIAPHSASTGALEGKTDEG